MRECNGDTECLRAVECVCVCLWLRRSWQTLKIEGATNTAVHEAVVTFLFEQAIHKIEYRSRCAHPTYLKNFNPQPDKKGVEKCIEVMIWTENCFTARGSTLDKQFSCCVKMSRKNGYVYIDLDKALTRSRE